MPLSIEDIAIKDVVSIDINSSLYEAINLMAKKNHRNIVIIDKNSTTKIYYFLDISDLFKIKLENRDENIPLNTLNLKKSKVLKRGLSILSVLNEIDETDKNMLIVDEDNLIGLVSYTDIINNIDPKILMKKQTIGNLILQYKALTIYENTSTKQVLKIMHENNTDAILITKENSTPIGIFTTKDFIKILDLNSNLNEPIKNYMNSPVITLNNQVTIEEAIDFIKEKHFKRIVVTDDDEKLMGILTQKELLRIVYNKWIDFIKEEGYRISKINEQLLFDAKNLEKKASYDYLTNLYNRAKFDSFLSYEISKINRYDKEKLSILLLDIDYFKNVNDTFGHLVGDNVLQEIAQIMTVCLRQSDIVARWGGEEFIAMLPETTIDQAYYVAEKLRATIENHSFDVVSKITCSIGIAIYHNNNKKSELFKRADEALYRAKNNGRNQVQIESKTNIIS